MHAAEREMDQLSAAGEGVIIAKKFGRRSRIGMVSSEQISSFNYVSWTSR
jgi:hypothetical protein